ncbi:MAG: DUF3576 domain-containing protein [Aestuariivita sp.]|nr:DUF3576 domain-containing protein [Aestuariivita sp.]MCY4202995.1 DUF3576 domain-containing protein [Aestuariivita sp.]
MRLQHVTKFVIAVCCCLSLTACGNNDNSSGDQTSVIPAAADEQTGGSSIWDLLQPDRTDQTVAVNRYLWAASLDILDFLPVDFVDPFTGVIATGYGTPPDGGRAYRATIHISDPALEARALRVSLQTRSGPISPETSRAVEDAILARARQMRIADNRF